MIGVNLSDSVRNDVMREKFGEKEDVMTKIKNNISRWFGK
jgi:hypothetical protein